MCRQASQPKIATTTSPLSLCTRAAPKRAGRRHTQRSPTAVPVPRSTPHGSDGTAPARCTDMRRPRAIPRRRSRSCPCHRWSWRGGPGDGPGWTVEPASGSSSLPCLDCGRGRHRLWRGVYVCGRAGIGRARASGGRAGPREDVSSYRNL